MSPTKPDLAIEAKAIVEEFRRLGINVDLYLDHEAGDESRVVWAFITSEPLGGILATAGEAGGWHPCFPRRANYPTHGTWYSGKEVYPWREAVCRALAPDLYQWPDRDSPNLPNMVASAARIDRLRALALRAVLTDPPPNERSQTMNHSDQPTQAQAGPLEAVSELFDFADPRNWPNKPGTAGPVDVYWEFAPGGWTKLQNPIRCF